MSKAQTFRRPCHGRIREPSWLEQKNLSPFTTATSKFKSVAIQLVLIMTLVGYICFPSHAVRHISSKESISQVSTAGRKVFSTLAEVGTVLSDDSDCSAGVAIVSACKNHRETFAKVLFTRLAVEGVQALVIAELG